MTIEETKEAVKIMQAFANGKDIEYYNADYCLHWEKTKTPSWDWRLNKYRIAPDQEDIKYKDVHNNIITEEDFVQCVKNLKHSPLAAVKYIKKTKNCDLKTAKDIFWKITDQEEHKEKSAKKLKFCISTWDYHGHEVTENFEEDSVEDAIKRYDNYGILYGDITLYECPNGFRTCSQTSADAGYIELRSNQY